MFIVQVAGRLGKDPETRFTPSGQKVTHFNIAVNQKKNKEDVTIWVRITIWGDRLDKILPHLKTGSAVIVIGRMNPPSSYVDKEGRTQFSLEVTAEMIEFSPFGRPAEHAEGTVSSAAHDQAGASHREEFSFSSQANAGYGMRQNAYGGNATSQNGHVHVPDDDALPF